MKFVRWSLLQRKGLFGGMVAVLAGGGYLAYGNETVRNYFNTLSVMPENEEQSYIYLHHIQKGELDGENIKSNWWPWRREREHKLHWHLLRLAKSKDKQVRRAAVKALADLPHLNDSEFREIAQACDLRTAVGLARTHGSDLRFFLFPPLQAESLQKNIEADFKTLLASLPQVDNKCIQYFTQYAINTGYHKVESDNQVNWWNVGPGLSEYDDHSECRPHSVSNEMVEKICLQALLSHSTIPSNRKLIIDKGTLSLLQQIYHHHKENHEMTSIIAQILGNLAEEKSLHKYIFMSGWIGTLALWLRSPHLELSLSSSRALANMDCDKISDAKYEDGIYVIYPQIRGREKHINADVIFIHGLLGGVFKTWRQNDRMKTCSKDKLAHTANDHCDKLDDKVKDQSLFPATLGIIQDEYTYCWPKDWLAHDCPHLRILAMDYHSHFSIWKDRCHLDNENRSLLNRGVEFLKKLVTAGVGDRPIIWVTHSMGGLLLKQMLLQAEASEDLQVRNVLKNTVGVVFCSVPHRGSALANMKTSLQLLLLPTIEVKEMRKDSSSLLELHKKFKDLVEKYNISCLSFGETIKTNIGLKWSALMVSLDSADPKFGEFHAISENHLNTCKPENKSSSMYQLLCEFIHNHVPHSLIEDILIDRTNPEDMETSVVMGLMQ